MLRLNKVIKGDKRYHFKVTWSLILPKYALTSRVIFFPKIFNAIIVANVGVYILTKPQIKIIGVKVALYATIK